MAAINFPDSPSDGDTHVVGQVTYTYNSAETKWKTTINSNNFLPTTGGTLTGNLNMGTNDLTVGDVTASGTASLSGLTYPTSDGTPNQFLQTNGSGTLSFATVETSNLTRLTNVSDPGTTSVDFTSIPSTAKRITVVFDSITRSTNNTRYMIQIGDSTGISTSGYQAACGYMFYNNTASSDGHATTKTGFEMQHSGMTLTSGMVTLYNPTGNIWVAAGTQVGGNTTSSWSSFVNGGSKELTGALDRIRFTSVSGAVTLNGNFNIFYEV